MSQTLFHDSTHQPLAARMRPTSLDQFIGQQHILGHGRLLRRAIMADQLTSLIFFGPPGTGKTSLAHVIAHMTKGRFITLNAVLDGLKELREALHEADTQKKLYSRKTILFVDEVHRWNKSQQDALLPWAENGTIIFIGATTENPFFEVNNALVSRSRIFQLHALQDTDMRQAVWQALHDKERGYGHYHIEIDPDALEHLVKVAAGDCRSLYNALELAVETHELYPSDTDTTLHIHLQDAEESIQQKAILYDKDGDYHYDTISAFIKSVRGSDADAALYWLAHMVSAGEDLSFIWRRLLILASEDIGLADPQAIGIVNACAMAFDRVGMPEGRFHLAQATLYLSTCPKSNSTMGFFDALRSTESLAHPEVPSHLRDGNRDKHALGHGKGYKYPHDFVHHWVQQDYLPSMLKGQLFYHPSDQGYEGSIRQQVLTRREAQLAAIWHDQQENLSPISVALPKHEMQHKQRWLNRSDQHYQAWQQLREHIFHTLSVHEHDVCLIDGDDAGYLISQALHYVVSGAVYAFIHDQAHIDALLYAYQQLNAQWHPQFTISDQKILPDDWPQKFDKLLFYCPKISMPRMIELLTTHTNEHGQWLVIVPQPTVILSQVFASQLSPTTLGWLQQVENRFISQYTSPWLDLAPYAHDVHSFSFQQNRIIALAHLHQWFDTQAPLGKIWHDIVPHATQQLQDIFALAGSSVLWTRQYQCFLGTHLPHNERFCAKK
jgi:putative ATPase